jgi:hypothetical protein
MSNKYIDFARLPITESEETDTLFGIREDGELVRCGYYTNPQIDMKIDEVKEKGTLELTAVQDELTYQIYKIRKDTVDLLGEAVANLSNI